MNEMGFLRDFDETVFKTKGKTNNFLDVATFTDEELVEIFIVGKDESALEEIINRYGDKVYRSAFRITRDHHSAEEVLQEVFLTLIKKLETFRGDARFSSWLYRVTLNEGYMYLRSNRKYGSDISLDNYVPYDRYGTLYDRITDKDWSGKPDEALFGREAMETIEKAVNELGEPYRIVFHLRDIEGLSGEETGKILGLSLSAVKSRLHRARLFLRDKLSDYFYEWSS